MLMAVTSHAHQKVKINIDGRITEIQNSAESAEGQFKKGAYYVIKSSEHRYRKDDLNAKSTAIFTV
ncbi:MAG: hypothetical protein Q4D26_05170 [Clostridia bacterium]|nr:hypothetical protein [Clostridia bacterium]